MGSSELTISKATIYHLSYCILCKSNPKSYIHPILLCVIVSYTILILTHPNLIRKPQFQNRNPVVEGYVSKHHKTRTDSHRRLLGRVSWCFDASGEGSKAFLLLAMAVRLVSLDANKRKRTWGIPIRVILQRSHHSYRYPSWWKEILKTRRASWWCLFIHMTNFTHPRIGTPPSF